MDAMQPPEILAHAVCGDFEIALRRRGEVIELIVNGVFAMDTVEVASEIALADAAPLGRVLVGGLGLGFTAARLLDRGVAHVDIVELAEPLLDWARAGITPQLGRVARDARVTLHAGDVASFVETTTEVWDAILLDVDNGPSFLIHDANARLYRRAWLETCLRRLTPGGVLLVWCEAPSPTLWDELRSLDADAAELLVAVSREGRSFDYALYRATRPAA